MTRSLLLGVLKRRSYNGMDTIAVNVESSDLNKHFTSPCTIHNSQ
jgi:hypothetical protein